MLAPLGSPWVLILFLSFLSHLLPKPWYRSSLQGEKGGIELDELVGLE